MNATIQKLLTLVMVGMTFALVNCSKGSSNDSSPSSTLGTSCGPNMLTSVYGCLPQCGPSMVTYNGQCVSATNQYGANQYGAYNQYGTQYGGQYGQGIGTQNPAMCGGQCGAGQTAMTDAQGRPSCLPQYSCGPCYGYSGGYCYQGTYARQYYGQ